MSKNVASHGGNTKNSWLSPPGLKKKEELFCWLFPCKSSSTATPHMQLFGGVDGRQGKEHSRSEAALEHTHIQCNPKVNVSIKSYINAHHVPVHQKRSQG